MDDDDFEISQFVGDVVVFKYGSVKWYLAKVEEAGSEAIAQGWNCTLNWWLDAAPSKTLGKLCASTQVVHFKPGDESQSHKQGSWLPVKLTDLRMSDESLASVNSPAKPANRGRPQSNRLAPAHGPTSKRKMR